MKQNKLLRCFRSPASIAHIVLLLTMLLTACAHAPRSLNEADRTPTADKKSCKHCISPTDSERLSELGQATAMKKVDREGRSFYDGPKRRQPTPKWNQVIDCHFVEPVRGQPIGGKTPKFLCDTTLNGESTRLRIKYQNPLLDKDSRRSLEENEGIWGEVLTSRLMWAMGFYTRDDYPVRVQCMNCPPLPWEYSQSIIEADSDELAHKIFAETSRDNYSIPAAIVTLNPEYPQIEQFHGQGWAWSELEKVRIDKPLDATQQRIKAEHDALVLLAAFFQHADNKPEQQEMRCLEVGDSEDKCRKPFILISDVGVSFGGGYRYFETRDPGETRTRRQIAVDESTASLKGFSSAPVWADEKTCRTSVRNRLLGGELANQLVSESGRQLFLERIALLSDQDILDLFKASRIEERDEWIMNGSDRHLVNANDWLPAFKARIEKIKRVTCPQ